MILLASSGTVMGVAVASGQTSALSASGSVFYLHYKSELYRSENASIILLEEANLTLPSTSTPRIIEVAAAIRNLTTIFGSIWVGSAAWVTQPLTEPASIHGTITFTVWLSSADMPPTFSGIGAGFAVLNQQNQTVGNYVYTYTYSQGTVLASTANQYGFKVDLNREISAGQRLVFAVGVGSTVQGWHMKIYYDDPQHPSRAQLPSSITVLPEFPHSLAILTTLLAMILSISGTQRKRRQLEKPDSI